MSRYNNSPVDPLKIQLIHDLLSSYPVNELWLKYVAMGNNGATVKQREDQFAEYCHYRDLYLGLPPVKIQGVQSTNRGYIRKSC